MSSDLDLAFVEVEFAPLRSGRFNDLRSLPLKALGRLDNFDHDLRLGALDQLLFSYQRRVAVEVWIREHAGRRTGVVKDVEPQLAVVIPDAGATTNDLFEIGHRADDTGKHDVLARGGVHTRRKELGRREDYRRSRLDVLEAVQMSAADIALLRGDPAHVVGVFSHQIGVEVTQGAAHLISVFLVHAEDDGLGEAVRLAEEFGQMLRDRFGTSAEGHRALGVRRRVVIVGDEATVTIEFVLAWPPPSSVPFGYNA